MPFRVGPMEMIILLVVVMMIFGIGRLPQVGSLLGKAIRDFRKVQEDVDEVVKSSTDMSPKKLESEKS